VVKCSKVLQCSDVLSNNVFNIIRRRIDNMKLLLINILLLSHSFTFLLHLHSIFYQCIYGCIFVEYCNLCIFMFLHSYCAFMYLHRANWHSSATLTEAFPCFFLSCKANARVKPTTTGNGPHPSKIFVLLYVLFVLCRSVYYLCVNVYCTITTGWLPICS
jgi:hypothetical protein